MASPDSLDVGARGGGLPGSRGVPAKPGRMEPASAGGWEARPVCTKRMRLGGVGGCVLDCPAVMSGGQQMPGLRSDMESAAQRRYSRPGQVNS